MGDNVKFLKNKHLLTASLMAPILALMSYFAIDALVGETPQAAEEGQSYQLVEKPNCRYDSGSCGLKNGDFELNLHTEALDSDRMTLVLKSVFPLDGVLLGLVENGADEEQPMDMRPMGDDGLIWSLDVARPNPETDRMHLVASSSGSLYFGDVSMKFTYDETIHK
jgi:hypothetical protein